MKAAGRRLRLLDPSNAEAYAVVTLLSRATHTLLDNSTVRGGTASATPLGSASVPILKCIHIEV